MKKSILFFILLLSNNLYSQENLLLNPDFEEYDNLPINDTPDGVSYAKYWFVPDDCSPNYYHRDCLYPYYQAFNEQYGNPSACSGEAYIGIFPFIWSGYMEHLTGTLRAPLIKGNKYIVTFFIRYAGNSCRYGVREIGVHFSKEKNPLNSYTPPFYPDLITSAIKVHVATKSDEALFNDSSWIMVSGVYLAKGGEKYITLGKFYDEIIRPGLIAKYNRVQFDEDKKGKFIEKHNNILPLNPRYNRNLNYHVEAPYYFIDDVSVELDTTQ